MTQQETDFIIHLQKQQERRKAGFVSDELEHPTDLIIIDINTREVRAKSVWTDIKLRSRALNLIDKESKAWNFDDRKVVCVARGSVGLWEILLKSDSRIINLTNK